MATVTAREESIMDTALGNDVDAAFEQQEDIVTALPEESRINAASLQQSLVDTQFTIEPTTAKVSKTKPRSVGHVLDALRADIKGLLKNATANRIFAPIEKHTRIKRKYMAIGATTLLGLYLLVGTAAQLVCNLIGVVYPTIVSVSAVRFKTPIDHTQWLSYWTMFAAFTLVDFIVGGLPAYFLFKTTFFVYLSLPQTNGAAHVFTNYVEPAIQRMEDFFQEYNRLKNL